MEMTKQQILDFLSDFQIIRQGNYNVPDFVLEAALDEYIFDRGRKRIKCYERINNTIECFYHRSTTPWYSEDDVAFFKDFLDGNLYWKTDILDGQELAAFKEVAFKAAATVDHRNSYPAKRLKAIQATGKRGVRDAVFSRDGYACKHCKATENLTIDHIIPVAKGGDDGMDNYQTLCRSCNSKKGAKYAVS